MEAHRKFYKYLDEVINDVEVSQQVRKRARELLEQKKFDITKTRSALSDITNSKSIVLSRKKKNTHRSADTSNSSKKRKKISSMATIADIELKYDSQENIENQIPEVYHHPVISQEKALLFIPPILEFSSFASTSKTTSSAVGKAPRKVLLWKEFFEKVNGYKFDVIPKFKKPEFHYSHLLNKESTVLTATDVNINMILNEIMGKNYDFSDHLAYIPGSDFTCYYMEETLILIMEVKRKHLFEDMNGQTFLEFYTVNSTVKTIIRQIYGYIVDNMLQYKTLSLQSTSPPIFKAYAYFALQAKDHHYSPKPSKSK
ncbi:22582_t:CDS:2 [Racocetra persica]|uniref:22582_t:CDS:1 n=1 Tax=Racocetra persica TaxID=160502 RepID=A0ACA9KS38_9GLOM|nr:22582_t:CDS:2 [Racocetra persica]